MFPRFPRRAARILAAVSAVASIGATAAPASAQSAGGEHRILGKAHRSVALCKAPSAHRASCLAEVVTDLKMHRFTTGDYADGYTPGQLQTAYGLTGSSANTLVAVVDAYANPTALESLNTYRSRFGLSRADLTQVNEDGGTDLPGADAGWGTEEMLDLEMVSAACPQCRILYVAANSPTFDDLGKAVNTAVRLGAKVVSNSYGGSESADEAGIQSKYYEHPGVAITASSGDSGYGVSVPAAFGSVVAVGGTRLDLTASGTRRSETVWTDAGSGCSRFVAKPKWQRDKGCTHRTVADVSAVADPDTGVAVYDGFQSAGWLVVGGTSVSAPIIAGIYGRTGHTSGTPAKRLYSAPKGSLYDITSGMNGTCSSPYLCAGTAGYDGPTGMGSPIGEAAF
ncbi:S53 family peptidase [Actinoallomurus sp. CA-150999]|uniref:S53 family peptidase n=1 Tax=Actinoallomurus sp. CA-150999 TaxID=3239887 RepID=UPI003D91C52A